MWVEPDAIMVDGTGPGGGSGFHDTHMVAMNDDGSFGVFWVNSPLGVYTSIQELAAYSPAGALLQRTLVETSNDGLFDIYSGYTAKAERR